MNTRQVTIKNTKDLPNLGVPVYLQITDDKIEAIVVGDGVDSIRICRANTYDTNLKVTKCQSMKTKEVYIVQGKLLGLSDYCSEDFETESLANEHLIALRNQHCAGDLGLEVAVKVIEYYEDSIK